MELLVIVTCLLSERFLVHHSAMYRFNWFEKTQKSLLSLLSKTSLLNNPWVQLLFPILITLLAVGLILFFTSHLLFGLLGLIFNIIIFYQCLGPDNPFYPIKDDNDKSTTQEQVGAYLSHSNRILFAVIFWYVLLGPVGLLAYRLITLSRHNKTTLKLAEQLTEIIEWIPARMTSLLYLLVGHFQAGIGHFTAKFLTSPAENDAILSTCGLQALGYAEEEALMPRAETLVEHATIVLLVVVAAISVVAWL